MFFFLHYGFALRNSEKERKKEKETTRNKIVWLLNGESDRTWDFTFINWFFCDSIEIMMD